MVDQKENEITAARGTDTVKVLLNVNMVATTINHPLWGRNTLHRKEVGFYALKKILNDPRIHTTKGFRPNPLLCPKCNAKRCYCPIGDPHYFCDHDIWQHKKFAVNAKAKMSRHKKDTVSFYQKMPNGKWKKKEGL